MNINPGGIFAQRDAEIAFGAEVLRFMPPDIENLIIEVSATYPTSMYSYQAVHSDGSSRYFDMDIGFDRDVISNLREAMYQEGLGTWFSAVLRVDRQGSVDGEFDYDSEPEWDAPVDPIVYVKDQEKFPRDVEHQPEWLKAKLAEGLARGQEG